MPAKIIVENYTADFTSDLGAALCFSVDNTGTTPVEIWFDESEAAAPLPPGSARQFDYLGDRYAGQMFGRFLPAPGYEMIAPVKKVTVVKTTFFCP